MESGYDSAHKDPYIRTVIVYMGRPTRGSNLIPIGRVILDWNYNRSPFCDHYRSLGYTVRFERRRGKPCTS